VAAIEDGRFADLPAGIYARTALSAYARAVGLEPSAVLARFEAALPSALLDRLVLAERRAAQAPKLVRRHGVAAAIDVGLLAGLNGAILFVCANVCGMSAASLLRAAPGSMLLLCATTVMLYFWLLGATDVRTAGPWLLDVEILPRATGPIRLNNLIKRGWTYMARECELMFVSRPAKDRTRV
jgi:hypothetical protein